MPIFKKYFSGLTKDTFLLTFASLFADISTEMLYPVLPIFLTQTLGASASVVGIVEGIATATQNIVQGFSGWLSDRMQKRKPIALIGYSLAAVSKPFMGIASIWQGVLLGRFSDRLGTGIRSAPRDGLIAASANEKSRGKAFGLEGIGDNLGAFLGPLLTACLLFLFFIPMRWIFYIAIIPGLLAVVLITFVRDRSVKMQSKSKLDIHVQAFSSHYWKYIAVTALFGIGNASNAFLILRTKQIGIPFVITIIVYAFFNLIAAVSSFPAGSLSDRFGRKTLLLGAFGIFILTYLGFALSTNYLLLATCFILYGIFSGTYRAVGKALATDFVTPAFRASAVGWFSTTIGFSGLVASLIAGQLWILFSPSVAFFYGASMGIVGTIALFFLVHPKGVTTSS